jgi:hypothetical protein
MHIIPEKKYSYGRELSTTSKIILTGWREKWTRRRNEDDEDNNEQSAASCLLGSSSPDSLISTVSTAASVKLDYKKIKEEYDNAQKRLETYESDLATAVTAEIQMVAAQITLPSHRRRRLADNMAVTTPTIITATASSGTTSSSNKRIHNNELTADNDQHQHQKRMKTTTTTVLFDSSSSSSSSEVITKPAAVRSMVVSSKLFDETKDVSNDDE